MRDNRAMSATPTMPETWLSSKGSTEPAPWLRQIEGSSADAILDFAALHGVEFFALQALPSGSQGTLRDSLRSRVFARAMWELRHQQLLQELLPMLQAANTQPILIKGTALAYALFQDPVQRARADTDVLVAPGYEKAAIEALRALGWKQAMGSGGELASYQCSLVRTLDGVQHVIDLHWRISNSQVLAKLFEHASLLRASVELPRLAHGARAAGAVDALLIACMHRAAHLAAPYYVNGEAHQEPDRLIWLMDIHLLASGFTDDQWRTFLSQAQEKGLSAVCLEGLQRAQHSWGTPIPEVVSQTLKGADNDLTSNYLRAGPLRQQWLDFFAVQGWRQRSRLLGDILFPAASYMHARFPDTRLPLALLYVRRAFTGFARRLLRTSAHAQSKTEQRIHGPA
jgi:hypothetical protein